MTTSALFILLVLIMVGLAGAALGRHGGITGSRAVLAGAAAAVLYLVVPASLASSGLLDQYAPVPRPMVLVVATTVMTVLAALSPLGGRVATSLALSTLVGFQAFRIPVELLLHRLAAEGVIPRVMTYTGWNFDIVTGISAAFLGLLLARGRVPAFVLRAWNAIGLLLLANIVTIAVLAAPVPFQLLTDGPSNTLPSSFPYVWLPTVLVQLALAGHILLFRRLRVEADV